MTDFTNVAEEILAAIEARGLKFKAFAKRMQKEAKKGARERARKFHEEKGSNQ